MKNLIFIGVCSFSLVLFAEENPSYYGSIGKCHLWKIEGSTSITSYIDYYITLSSKRISSYNGEYRKEALIIEKDFLSLKEAAKLNPKCEFDKSSESRK